MRLARSFDIPQLQSDMDRPMRHVEFAHGRLKLCAQLLEQRDGFLVPACEKVHADVGKPNLADGERQQNAGRLVQPVLQRPDRAFHLSAEAVVAGKSSQNVSSLRPGARQLQGTLVRGPGVVEPSHVRLELRELGRELGQQGLNEDGSLDILASEVVLSPPTIGLEVARAVRAADRHPRGCCRMRGSW